MTQARFRVGNLELLVMSDGSYYLDAGAVFGVVPRERWEPYAGPIDSHHRLALGTNCVALRSQGKAILIETGVGDKSMRKDATPLEEGNLLTELEAGFGRPEDIDVVINSHLHGDHCGWNTRYVDGKLVPTFPKAEYLIQRAEWEAATHPNERTRATYLAENLTPVAESGRLRLLDGETKVTDEVTIVPTPGHSEGTRQHHHHLRRRDGDLHRRHGVSRRCNWSARRGCAAFDMLPLMSMEAKKRLVEKAIQEKALLICVHLPFPGAGHMTRTPDGYKKWVPA